MSNSWTDNLGIQQQQHLKHKKHLVKPDTKKTSATCNRPDINFLHSISSKQYQKRTSSLTNNVKRQQKPIDTLTNSVKSNINRYVFDNQIQTTTEWLDNQRQIKTINNILNIIQDEQRTAAKTICNRSYCHQTGIQTYTENINNRTIDGKPWQIQLKKVECRYD